LVGDLPSDVLKDAVSEQSNPQPAYVAAVRTTPQGECQGDCRAAGAGCRACGL